jgi:hypothetical protein
MLLNFNKIEKPINIKIEKPINIKIEKPINILKLKNQ